MQQYKFSYSPLEKIFEKQIKTTADQRGKQIKALEGQWKTISWT